MTACRCYENASPYHTHLTCVATLQGEVDLTGWHRGLAQLRERGAGPAFAFPHAELQVSYCFTVDLVSAGLLPQPRLNRTESLTAQSPGPSP